MPLIMSLLNYVHLISVMSLVGMLIFIRFVSTPLMRRLEPEDPHAIPLLVGAADKVVFFGWIFVVVIAVNGVILMLLNPEYNGFMVIEPGNHWQLYMFVKHNICILLLLGLVAYSIIVKQNKKRLARKADTRKIGKLMDLLALVNAFLAALVFLSTTLTQYGLNYAKVVALFLHELLLSGWIGGLFFVLFIGTPLIKRMVMAKELTIVAGVHHMQMIANRFIKVLWLAMFVSIFTGFSLLFLDKTYDKFLTSADGSNLVMAIKVVVFLVTILGAFVVTPAIVRLGEYLKQAGKMEQVSKEMIDIIMKERAIIVNGARYGFSWLQLVLIITAVLGVVKQ